MPRVLPAHPPLLHLNLRELLLFGFLENKGMVVIGAAFGVGWETGLLDRLMGRYFADGSLGRGFFRDLFRAMFGDGPLPVAPLGMTLAGIVAFLVAVRIVSMGWALVRLYDFRLTRVNEDLAYRGRAHHARVGHGADPARADHQHPHRPAAPLARPRLGAGGDRRRRRRRRQRRAHA